MSSPLEPGPTNGYGSPEGGSPSPIVAAGHQSDSDLSDMHDNAARLASSSPSPDPNDLSGYMNGAPDFAESESSGDENNASDDADFDMDEDAASVAQSDGAGDVHSDSNDSQRPTKRKVPAREDDYIKANPELYGLRRSSRPTQQRRMVDSSDESESDVVPTNRRVVKRRRVETSRQSSKRGTPARQPSTNSDSDSDNYGGARAKSLQKKARRQREAQPSALLAEKRWSSRRAAQVQQGAYEESDVDDEDEDMLTPNYYAADVVDDSPYIDKVLRHKLKDGLELSWSSTRTDFEYFVKWQGKSHLHDTWETAETLRSMRGYRRVENYFRTIVEHELLIRYGEDIPPETKEQFFLDRERAEEALEDFTKVDRVVAVRDGDEETEYLVKWKGCYYDECTWEVASAISADFQDKIDQFLDRSSRSWVSDRKESNPDTRTRMTKLESQPDFIKNGELRSFQLRGLNFLCLNWTRANNVILADEMGLGKTVQSVSFLSWLRNEREQEGPFLIVAPLSVIPAWGDTFDNWSPDMNYVVYLGNEASRSTIRDNELMINGNPKKPKFNALITSYEMILQDWQFLQQIKWQALLVDEAHRLKNKESQLYARLVSFGVPCKILITGTPIQNNLAELSALMDFLNPGKVVIDEELEDLAGNDTQEKLQDLHKSIAPYILRRTKETVESDLPPKTEKIIRVELSDVQLDYYKNILTRNYAALSSATGQKNSLLNIMMELKKVSNHPYMFAGAEERVLAGSTRREDQIKGLIASSGKMMLLDQLLTKLKKDGHRVLVFSQMVKMLDILSDYMALRGYKFQRLDGTIAAGPRRMAINHFNAEDSDDFCFLLSTRAGGLGINLMTADTVVIFDSDWNPQADLQAMGRAHRIGQKKPVSIYRLVSKETVEEEVLERARNKLLLEYLTIQAGVTDDGKAFRDEMNKKGLKIDGPNSAEDIQLILKMRSQKMFEQSGNQERLEQLDIDSILENAEITKTKVDDKMNLSSGGIDWDNFMQYTDVKVDDLALDWDQIIPAEELAVIKADEEQRKNEEYVAKVAAESAPRRATMKNRNETDRSDRLAKKRQREEQQRREAEEQRALLSDPKRPLNEKETRNLLKAFFRYGSMDDRGEEIVQEARLGERDRDFLKSILDDFVKRCEDALNDNNTRLMDDERKLGKSLTKKDKKAVLVDFGEVRKMNAETAVERPQQLRLLRQTIRKSDDFKTFRLADATKAAHYSCEWGAREDGMLLVGIDKYGFGAWTQIRDDATLDMSDKFFLEEHRIEKKEERNKATEKGVNSPGAVHLVRRSEYLLSVLAAKHSSDPLAHRTVENHHRNNKRLANGHRRSDVGSGAASPAPPALKKSGSHRDRERSHADHHRSRSNADEKGTPRPDSKRKHSGHDEGRIPKHRRTDEARRTKSNGDEQQSPRADRPRHRDEGERSSKLRRPDDHRHGDDRRRSSNTPRANQPDNERRNQALHRLDQLRKMGDNKEEREKDADAMLWYLLKPVRANFEAILVTTKERIKSSKERAKIFGEELVVIGNFLDREFVQERDNALKNRFWEFLANLWPVDSTSNEVTGDRLSAMYRVLRDREVKKHNGDKPAAAAANGTAAAS
ncbi:SNF2 super family protein [Colletotrichum scovillei]|uniref:Chromodomain-helicase-DNA-binding protein 1 n=1 Tax=Colletotrichum scovillei TaxID=1209932 RepID=A0A9P7RJJ0_9PEZI|nr:SNF2 super family protein [Colletotrichum scovillei]KAF4777716.1 SNF2 super family protein [Colletotrichum scovillei]KAG7058694.1 chromodomain-helicase-DNA-binding protein 1 [Colletotrichum scovillei]KAG7077270.1 chromodomain-helicase-DNA-binding protein 1 [Colletotrichum scovillei]KAG7084411.1 chromodomain-helicase-DNA-binding protein 1 [Colletotrichum scovillei]